MRADRKPITRRGASAPLVPGAHDASALRLGATSLVLAVLAAERVSIIRGAGGLSVSRSGTVVPLGVLVDAVVAAIVAGAAVDTQAVLAIVVELFRASTTPSLVTEPRDE